MHNFLNQKIKIYIVSLKTADVRRKQIQEQLDKLGLKYEFFTGINAKENPEVAIGQFSQEKAIQNLKREISESEVGCSLSHREVSKRVLADGGDLALVLEDDAEIDSGILDIFNSIQNYKNQFEVILLGYSKLAKQNYAKFFTREPLYKIKFKISQYNFGEVARNWTSGGVGYFITAKGAEKMVKVHEQIYSLADSWDIFERDVDLKILHCRPLVIHEQFQTLESSLEADRKKSISKKIKTNMPKEYFYVVIKITLINLGLHYRMSAIRKRLEKFFYKS